MYENSFKNTKEINLSGLNDFLNLIADTNESLEFFAIGGTAMVLKNIKESTRDIDFLTEENYDKISRIFRLAGLKEESPNKVCNIWRFDKTRIDIFYDGFIMGIPFPEDWKEKSEIIKEIGKIKLYILNWYDIIMSRCLTENLFFQDEVHLEHPKNERLLQTTALQGFLILDSHQGLMSLRFKLWWCIVFLITKISRSEKRDIEDITAIIKSRKINFNELKKRYFSIAETALISDYKYKFEHLERTWKA